jgi:hypothetical protein
MCYSGLARFNHHTCMLTHPNIIMAKSVVCMPLLRQLLRTGACMALCFVWMSDVCLQRFLLIPYAAAAADDDDDDAVPSCSQDLEVIDVSEAPLHCCVGVWGAMLDALPPTAHVRIIMREHSAWARGAMGLLSE